MPVAVQLRLSRELLSAEPKGQMRRRSQTSHRVSCLSRRRRLGYSTRVLAGGKIVGCVLQMDDQASFDCDARFDPCRQCSLKPGLFNRGGDQVVSNTTGREEGETCAKQIIVAAWRNNIMSEGRLFSPVFQKAKNEQYKNAPKSGGS